MSSLRQKFVSWLKEQLGCIYVWGGQGETNITEAWIRKMEETTANAERVIAFWKKRVNAGATNLAAYDCSGLVTVFLIANGVIKSDTTSRGLYSLCNQSIKRADLVAGDLVFRHDGSKIYHVGVYIGNNRVIHARGRDYGVVEETIDANGSSYWNRYGRIPNLPLDGTENNAGGINDMEKTLTIESPLKYDANVKKLQEVLNAWGYNAGKEDGLYGENSRKAVRAFSANHGGGSLPDSITVTQAIGGKTYFGTLEG